jgi:hypothetical protein
VADPQSLLEEKEAAVEKLAISDYELRLAQEDISKLKSELQKKTENLNDISGNFLQDNVTSVSFIFYVLCFVFNVLQFLHNYVDDLYL